MMKKEGAHERLPELLHSLRLPTFAEFYEELGFRAEREGWRFEQYLEELSRAELRDRGERRVERLLKASGLPREKTLTTLGTERLPPKVRRQLASLSAGEFVDRADNVLAFGNPGVGKTHLLCAIGHELVKQGVSVLFIAAHRLVQRLLVAKRELKLEGELRRLDGYQAVIVDDIGYVQQDREEMEVLFTFLAERYERKSVLISSNLVFSQWERIFKDPMTTAAAIDRLVHHAVIVELTGPSYRTERAKARVMGERVEGGVAAGAPGAENRGDGVIPAPTELELQ